ncbi:hypothetical protein BU26DRAFT_562738 [Trematosphaeria pertusa]|uniref:BTB domain-containing protein n=1 Tax=Trematosphaeria pertusa TaxID=390896 RepID=A0A6A6IKP2_9PLEO|nr:uncharacterized protein BU26DRAFT_562738 [Trematosphaeria pertusa]KAF2250779.1 hypothetical protein BU26DRAFT_562738 [Trematosphaeria pertusa]
MPRLSGKNVYFDESSKANVNIKVQGYTLHAHKDILRQHVCFDNCLRSGTWSEACTGIIKLREHASYVVILLEYIYHGHLNTSKIDCKIAKRLGRSHKHPRNDAFHAEHAEHAKILIDLWDLGDRYFMSGFCALCADHFTDLLVHTPGARYSWDV